MNEGHPVDLCLAALRFYPDYAGPAQRFQRYAPGFGERGVNMRVFSGAWGTDGSDPEHCEYRGDGDFLPPLEVDGVPIQRVWINHRLHRDRLMLAFFRGLARHVATGPKPDVLLLLNSWSWATPWLWSIRRAGVPLVLVQTMVRDPDVRWLSNLAWSHPMKAMDRLVVSTGVMHDALVEAGIQRPIVIIPNGVDLKRFRPCESDAERRGLRTQLGLGIESEIITFVGGFLNRRKGLDVLVEAWGRLARSRPKALLVLVGPHLNTLRPEGPQAQFLERLRASLTDSGAEDRVVFTGKVDAVEDYLRVTDVFVFPSRREGMPNVVPEAFACGVASVLTPFIGLPTEFGEPGQEYILVDRDAASIAAAVGALLDDGERRASLGAAARRWVETELGVEKSLDKYADLFRDLKP